MLSNLALLSTEEGPLGVQSREEVKDILFHHLGVRKHECYVYHTYPEPFILKFFNVHVRDLVLRQGRVIDGPLELRFHA